MGTRFPCPRFSPRRLAAVVVAAVTLALAAAPSGALAADPVVMAAGDIACASPGSASPGPCSQTYTAERARLQQAAPEGLAGLLALGDLQYDKGELANFQQYFGASWGQPALRSVLRPVPGNHEYETGDAAGYFDYFNSISVNVGARGQGWYSFDVGDWHIVALNSSNKCSPVSCAAGSAQESWLRADLAATQKACTMAYWHHPIAGNPAGRPIFSALYELGVEAVLAGHTHSYERNQPLDPDGSFDPNGPREFVVGTGGHSGPAQGLLKMTLRAGSMAYRFDGVGASDSGTVTCRGGTPPPPRPPPPPPPVVPTPLGGAGGSPSPEPVTLPAILGPPSIVVATDRRGSSVTTRRARSIVRAAVRTRLRRWTLTSVTCRTAGTRKATCRFRVRLGGRRISASGTVTLSSTSRSLGYRFTVRYVKGPRRTSTWIGQTKV